MPWLALQVDTPPASLIQLALPIILGAVIGFVVSELRARLDLRRTDKTVLKRVLYNQLELWTAVRVADPNLLITKALKAADIVVQKLGGPPGIIADAIKDVSDADQQKYLEIIKVDFQESMLERYEQSLRELSSVDPILTYKLINKASLGLHAEFEKKVDTFVLKFNPLILASKSHAELIEKLKKYAKQEDANSNLQKIKKDIRNVAWRVSYRTWLRVWWMFTADEYFMPTRTMASTLRIIKRMLQDFAQREQSDQTAPSERESNDGQNKTVKPTEKGSVH